MPADNLPIIQSEFKLESAELVKEKEIQDPQYFTNFLGTVDIQRTEVKNNQAPTVKYRDGPISNIKIEDVGLLGLNAPKIGKNFYEQSNKISKKISFESTGVSEFFGLDNIQTFTQGKKITELSQA